MAGAVTTAFFPAFFFPPLLFLRATFLSLRLSKASCAGVSSAVGLGVSLFAVVVVVVVVVMPMPMPGAMVVVVVVVWPASAEEAGAVGAELLLPLPLPVDFLACRETFPMGLLAFMAY